MANKLWGSLKSQDLALVPVPPATSLMPSPYERPGTAPERRRPAPVPAALRPAPVPAALPYKDLTYVRTKGYQSVMSHGPSHKKFRINYEEEENPFC